MLSSWHLFTFVVFATYVGSHQECGVNDNNILFNDIQAICHCTLYHHLDNRTMTLNNVSLFFESLHQCLVTEIMPLGTDTQTIAVVNDTIKVLSNNDTSKKPKRESTTKKASSKSFNFASFDSGAMILSKSDGIKSAKSILIDREDKYMMIPCELGEKWFVIQLSEDIVMDRMELSNFEHYSSNFEHIRIYAQSSEKKHERHESDDDDDDEADHPHEPPDDKKRWILLKEHSLSDHTQNVIKFTDKKLVRLLKIEILSYYGSEYYCTVTQIKVFGSTMLPHWKNELLLHLDEVDQLKLNMTAMNDTSASAAAASSDSNDTQTISDKSHANAVDNPAHALVPNREHNLNDELSVFQILTKRITSLELNLTKQQIQVQKLVHLLSRVDAIDTKFNEFQLNITNHLLFYSYGISMVLKGLKDRGVNVEDAGLSDIDIDVEQTSSSSSSSYVHEDIFRYGQSCDCDCDHTYGEQQSQEIYQEYMYYLLIVAVVIMLSQFLLMLAFALYILGYIGTKKNQSDLHPLHKRPVLQAHRSSGDLLHLNQSSQSSHSSSGWKRKFHRRTKK